MNKVKDKLTNRYLFIVEDSHSRRTFILEENQYSIGRHSSNSIVLYSRQISRRHATLIRKVNRKTNQDSFWILDGDLEGNRSQNKIFVNGEKCLVHELRDGDLINFGCEVNASYHILSPQIISETIFNNNQNQQTLSQEVKSSEQPTQIIGKFPTLSPNDPHQNETLLLNNYHLENTNDEDTFIEKSYLDALTELPNQILFNEYLSIALTNAQQNQTLVAMLLVDLKDFSHFNQKVGYGIGDRVLQSLGQRFKSCVRSGDIIGRWGADEFSILFTQIKAADDLEKIIQRILKTLQKPLEIDQNTYALNYNFGLSLYPKDGGTVSTLNQQAENQLSQHKKLKAQGISEYNDLKFIPQLSKIEQRLYKALEKQEFVLYYQPQVNIITGQIEAIEALIRWHHPKQGLLLPQKFLPWFEKTDIIIPLTRWVLETACTQTKVWQRMGLPKVFISINLSIGQFYHPQLITLITQILSATKLDSHWVELEITESTVLHDIKQSYPILKALQKQGISLCLDDFGKGYAAIRYLSDSPFQKLKIDLSVIKKLRENPDNTAMISALIALGENFQMRVVAEGVETQQQLDTLHSLQCEAMQGYKFSHPLPVQQATEFLKAYQQPL